MTSKERLYAIVQRSPIDQTPLILWPAGDVHSDAAIVSIRRLANAGSSPRVVLVEILSPLSRAIKAGLELNAHLHDDPAEGERILNELIEETRREIKFVLGSKVDGIFYRLQGAEPRYSTPMQYGGHYLEADRQLLELACEAQINVVFLEGGPDVYVDFVSDLPGQVFAWDRDATGIELATVRKLRNGILATADPDADILFGHNYGLLQPWIKKTLAETNV